MRAERLSDSGTTDNIMILAENSVEAAIQSTGECKFLIVDSIQTMSSMEISGTPGNIGQVRQATASLVEFAKRDGIAVFIVGHVTKSGHIAGPKVLEHAVDVVLTMEGDRQSDLRLLRATKNRFGATGEIGVFSMGERGFAEVENPSAAFIAHHERPVPGSVIFAGMEGERPLFVEIQALASPAAYGTPQRVAQGIDYRRLILLAAILERRAGFQLSRYDLFVNVVGGFDITERSADIAVILSIVSSLRDLPVKQNLAVMGEIGLTGELRRVYRTPARLKEAERLGFEEAIIPKSTSGIPKLSTLKVKQVNEIYSAFEAAFEKKGGR
jgi:DNA repair protein RadA/Sms